MNHPLPKIHPATNVVTLPAWADCDEGRALAAQIITDQPDYRITPGQWIDGGGKREYRGRAASGLRRLFNAELERLGNMETAAFMAGQPWQQLNVEVNELLSQERPEELIERLTSPLFLDPSVSKRADGHSEMRV